MKLIVIALLSLSPQDSITPSQTNTQASIEEANKKIALIPTFLNFRYRGKLKILKKDYKWYRWDVRWRRPFLC